MTDTHAHRGRDLEHAVREYFKRLRALGIPCHQNHPRRLTDGTPAEKNDYDFEVLHAGRLYAFDAKMCADAAWRFDKRFLHQEKALHDVTAQGGEGFFLVFFTTRRVLIRFRVPLPAGKAALRPEDGELLKRLDFLGIFETTTPR